MRGHSALLAGARLEEESVAEPSAVHGRPLALRPRLAAGLPLSLRDCVSCPSEGSDRETVGVKAVGGPRGDSVVSTRSERVLLRHDQPTKTTEETAGGLLGKLAGKAKAAAGSLLGDEDLAREGRLQEAGSEAEIQAQRAEAEAEVERRQAEIEAERAEIEEERGAWRPRSAEATPRSAPSRTGSPRRPTPHSSSSGRPRRGPRRHDRSRGDRLMIRKLQGPLDTSIKAARLLPDPRPASRRGLEIAIDEVDAERPRRRRPPAVRRGAARGRAAPPCRRRRAPRGPAPARQGRAGQDEARETEQRRKAQAAEAERNAQERIDEQARRERLQTLRTKEQALDEQADAATARDEALRLQRSAAKAKAARKERANSGGRAS